MARHIQDIHLGQPTAFVEFMMKDYLCKNSFSKKTWYGSPVNRRGDGIFESFRYLIWSYSDGTLHLEAWFRAPFYSEQDEQDLTGLWKWAAKTSYRKEIDKLIELLQQQLPDPSIFEDAASDGPTPMQLTTVQTFNNNGSAILSLVFGLASIILPIVLSQPDTVLDRKGFYWLPSLTSNGLIFWPYSMFVLYLVSLIFGRLGVVFYRSGKNSSNANLAKIGLVSAIVGMIFPLLYFLANLFLLLYLYFLAYSTLPW